MTVNSLPSASAARSSLSKICERARGMTPAAGSLSQAAGAASALKAPPSMVCVLPEPVWP